MPPDSSRSGSALITALAGRSLGSELLGGLAAGLMGGSNNGALFIDLLRSDSVTGRMIDRFDLLKVYSKRYRVDAAKALMRSTTIIQDKKSGVITLEVKDQDPRRARDMAQAYLEELNAVVIRTSSSSAHQERVFIEKRLTAVKGDLEKAQDALSEFSSRHSTVDLGAQTKATVESEAKVQGELIVAQGDLESLEQIYGNGNVRVRAAEARVSSLKRELGRMGGSAAPLAKDANESESQDSDNAESYLPLRQVPRLAVPYTDLYRESHVQEAVYDLLTQQYEIARIQEAKDVPAVNVIDAPGIPEKKSFPPRAVVTLALTSGFLLLFSICLIWREHWLAIYPDDPRRAFAAEVVRTARDAMRRATGRMRGRS
jgi:capsule polysaccharide export protein KpsE/RkpR